MGNWLPDLIAFLFSILTLAASSSKGGITHFDALHIGLTATPSAYIERNTFEFMPALPDADRIPIPCDKVAKGDPGEDPCITR
jgi:hypothetical protein